MKILAFPKDENPYQEGVYAEMRSKGHAIAYVGKLTHSHTANVALLPAELLMMRLRGFRVLHIHWLYPFALPVASGRSAPVRRLMRQWLRVVLGLAAITGLRIVWVAHNILPHTQVFDDDAAARRLLVRRSSAVIAHSEPVLTAVSAFGPLPEITATVRIPAYEVLPPAQSAVPGVPLALLFFGVIARYKGVDDLIRAAGQVPHPLSITIVGECRDAALAVELTALASAVQNIVHLDMRRVPDDELNVLLSQSTFVVLPFRSISTSSSAVLALSAGRPVIVPRLEALANLPDAATVRYPITADRVGDLVKALSSLAEEAPDASAMGEAGRAWACSYTWKDLAEDYEAVSRRCVRPIDVA